jgi:hypothetical protein
VLTARPGPRSACETVYDAQSATVAGRVIRAPCGDPRRMEQIRLTERFAGGGAALRTWKTGWDGRYWFEGLEPGSELTLDAGPATVAVQLPPLAPGQQYGVPDIAVPGGC